MSVSIIVPVYGALEYARACLESLYAVRTTTPFEVIVVNNGSLAEVRLWLEQEQPHRANLRVLHFDEPLGFARAVNRGARVARYEHLVLLNSDTMATDGWLDSLEEVLDADPGIGIVSPVTNSCGSKVQVDNEAAKLDELEALAYADRIRERREVVFEPHRLSFFCVMIRRSLWEHLAGLAESYRTGNFEDDDFCLRTRLLGYRLGVVRNAFVFHHGSKTFKDREIDHSEWMARNRVLFHSRASRWAKSALPLGCAVRAASDVTVIVPVPRQHSAQLRDSLTSLANQTTHGFEVIVVAADDVSQTIGEFTGRLHLTQLGVTEARADRLGALLNVGLDATQGKRVAFLPAGDIYYPPHLEVLMEAVDAGANAAYTAWAFDSDGRSGAVGKEQAAPDRLWLGDWAPLACWMCSTQPGLPRFNESLRDFTAWDFAMSVSEPRYLRRFTCMKQVSNSGPSADEAREVMTSFPLQPGSDWQQEERRGFLRAVESGAWEAALVYERSEVERRARRLLGPPEPLTTSASELETLRTRLVSAAECVESSAAGTTAPDVLLFNIVGWTHLTQRPHHLARGLAARGHRVFWIDVRLKDPSLTDSASLARRLETNVFCVELPAADGEFYLLRWTPAVVDAMEAAVAWLRSSFGIAEAVQLVNFPKWTPLVERLRSRFGWPVVYDCLDNQQAFGDLHRLNDAHHEEKLARDAAMVITSGRILFDIQREHNPNTVLIPNAADYETFADAEPAGLLEDLPRPVIGFFGAFSEWLDRGWIREVAKRFPDWSFVYIGRLGFARSASRRDWLAATAAKNVTVLPQVDLPTLAKYLAEFDVSIMPFRDLAITRSMNAVKIFEYLAAGKPVVAPDLPETRPLADQGLITVYRTWEESFGLLEEAVASGNCAEASRRRRAFAAENTWRHRVDELTAALQRITVP